MNPALVNPQMLSWARKRAGFELERLAEQVPQLPLWERGEKYPTFKQLESFAKRTRVPLGYLFLSDPPTEDIPIADFRTVAQHQEVVDASPDLLDTIYAMQLRQDWLRSNRIECGAIPIGFVGSAALTDDPDEIGNTMRVVLGLDSAWTEQTNNWESAVSQLRRRIEQIGVMAIINGVVGNNAQRKLEVQEFRGFALCDDYAPLIFVNGADAKSAQMFTLAHELAHIWLGEIGEGVSKVDRLISHDSDIERFCDRAAAEFLLPARELSRHWPYVKDDHRPFHALARLFKVSPIVAGRRALDLHFIDHTTFFSFYEAHTSEEQSKPAKSGGSFYVNQDFRVGRLFATEAMNATVEGRLSFKDAYYLTQLKAASFQKYAEHLGIELT